MIASIFHWTLNCSASACLQHVLAAAAREVVPGAGVDEAELEGRAVEAGHLCVLAEQDPGEAAAVLHRLQDVRPHAAGIWPAAWARRRARPRAGAGAEARRRAWAVGAGAAWPRARGSGRPWPGPGPERPWASRRGAGRRPAAAAGRHRGRGSRARGQAPRPGRGGLLRLGAAGVAVRRLGSGAGGLGGLPGAGAARSGTDVRLRLGLDAEAPGLRRCRRARPRARRPVRRPAGPPRARQPGTAARRHRRHAPRAPARTPWRAPAAPRENAAPRLAPAGPAGPDRPLVVEGGGQQHPGADQLQLEPGRGGAAHLGQPGVDQVGGPAQLGGAEDGGLRLHPLDHVGGGVDEPLLRRVRHGGQDHQVPQPLQQVGDEAPRVVAALDDPVDDLEGRGPVTRGEGLDDRVEQRPVGVPEQGGGHGVRHTVLGGAGEQLVHDGHRVTHGPGPGPHDERQHTVLDRDGLLARTPRRGSPAASRAAPAGTDSGASATGSSR